MSVKTGHEPILRAGRKYSQTNEYKAQMTEPHDKGDIFLPENVCFFWSLIVLLMI